MSSYKLYEKETNEPLEVIKFGKGTVYKFREMLYSGIDLRNISGHEDITYFISNNNFYFIFNWGVLPQKMIHIDEFIKKQRAESTNKLELYRKEEEIHSKMKAILNDLNEETIRNYNHRIIMVGKFTYYKIIDDEFYLYMIKTTESNCLYFNYENLVIDNDFYGREKPNFKALDYLISNNYECDIEENLPYDVDFVVNFYKSPPEEIPTNTLFFDFNNREKMLEFIEPREMRITVTRISLDEINELEQYVNEYRNH